MRSKASRKLILLALLGAMIGATICLADLVTTRDKLGGLVTANDDRWEASVVFGDLPDEPHDSGGSHDGGFFYVIARNPFDVDQMSTSLDFPRFRVQRIFYPAIVWLAHPTGGGIGLVWTMFAVNLVGLVIGGVATGKLSTLLGGPVWPAVVFGPMFGSIISLRLSVSDSLGLALVIAALVLSLQSRHRWAIAVAVAAVLTKESALVVFLGFAWWRRDRHGATLFAVPLAVAGLWWAWLAVWFGGSFGSPQAYQLPLVGWKQAVDLWLAGVEPLGMLSAVSGVAIAVVALLRTRPSHPLWWPLALLLGTSVVFSVHILAPERNASRLFLPMQILGIVALVTRTYRRRPGSPASRVIAPATVAPLEVDAT